MLVFCIQSGTPDLAVPENTDFDANLRDSAVAVSERDLVLQE
jgi:hypothetical protein